LRRDGIAGRDSVKKSKRPNQSGAPRAPAAVAAFAGKDLPLKSLEGLNVRLNLKHSKLFAATSIAALVSLLYGSLGWAYPGGPRDDVTDAAPFCAACHASTSPDQLRGLPPQAAAQETVAAHLNAIKAGQGSYAKLTPDQRTKLITDVQEVDQNADVIIKAPEKVHAGHDFDVVVSIKGGSGPTDGVMLVDSDIRHQARPAPSEGFLLVAPPKVIGPDGNPQDTWVAKRYDGLSHDIEFVLIFGVNADLAAHKFATAQVTYRVKAPAQPGKYNLTAAFLYGTETASPIGHTAAMGGHMPIGGFASHSGRVRFAVLKTITVSH
jgi:hypothetical protein